LNEARAAGKGRYVFIERVIARFMIIIVVGEVCTGVDKNNSKRCENKEMDVETACYEIAEG